MSKNVVFWVGVKNQHYSEKYDIKSPDIFIGYTVTLSNSFTNGSK